MTIECEESESSSDNEESSSSSSSSSSQRSPAIAMVASVLVAAAPLSPQFRRESIAVGDTGTEVTLRDGKYTPATTSTLEEDEDEDGYLTDHQPNHLVDSTAAMFCRGTPNTNSNRPRSFSLLDNDVASVVTTTTMTPLSPETPISSSSILLPLCGVGGCWLSSAASPEESSPPNIRASACMDNDGSLQDYLYEFLSDPASAATAAGGHPKSFPWQSMLTSMADEDSDDDEDDKNVLDNDDDEQDSEIKKHRMKILRNRAIHLQARKERLITLRRDLYPFSSPATPPPPLAMRSSSLALGGNGNSLPRSQSQPISAPTKPRRKPLQDRTLLQPQAWSSWSCHNIPQSPDALVWEDNEQGENGGCYDSDPEDFLRMRNYTASSSSSSPPTPSAQEAPVKNKRKSAFNSSNGNNIVSDDLYPGNNIYDIVHGAFNERWTFILHPGESEHGNNPCAVQAWMERGQRLSTTVIPPKLVYQFIGKTPSSSSSSSLSTFTLGQQRSRVLGTTTPLYSIDLLEIQRVLEIHQVNRKLYPFAKAHNTFTITTLSETVCLEASSKSERDRFVCLLKLLVARFGSQLVTGDYRVEEFFTMLGNGPGGQVEYNRLY